MLPTTIDLGPLCYSPPVRRAILTIADSRKEKGLILDANGLRQKGKIIAAGTEEEIYEALGLSFIEPELREGRGEITLARKQCLPNLVTDNEIRGILRSMSTGGMLCCQTSRATPRRR